MLNSLKSQILKSPHLTNNRLKKFGHKEKTYLIAPRWSILKQTKEKSHSDRYKSSREPSASEHKAKLDEAEIQDLWLDNFVSSHSSLMCSVFYISATKSLISKEFIQYTRLYDKRHSRQKTKDANQSFTNTLTLVTATYSSPCDPVQFNQAEHRTYQKITTQILSVSSFDFRCLSASLHEK